MVIPFSIREFLVVIENEKMVEILKSSSWVAKLGGPSGSKLKNGDKKKPYSISQLNRSGVLIS